MYDVVSIEFVCLSCFVGYCPIRSKIMTLLPLFDLNIVYMIPAFFFFFAYK